MKKKIADKWVAALRSGQYQQARGLLRDDDGYCCLGVLCDISEKGEWRNRRHDDISWDFISDGIQVENSVLPYDVQLWAGIQQREGRFTGPNDQNWCLAAMNDEGRSFEEIATIIEKYWEKL